MKPGKANTPVILGQPWQRTYNGVPNWRREGINFEYDQARLFTPFLKDEDFATDTESDDEERNKEPKENAPKTTEQQDSTPRQSPTNHANGEETRLKESKAETSQPKEQVRTKHTQLSAKNAMPHQDIWVPKKTVQAQQGSTQIWIPKRVVREPYGNRPRTQVSKRKQERQKTTKKTTQRAAHSKKASKKGQQKTKRIWVKKTLLKAQEQRTYKWVPKQLLNKATICTKQPSNPQQGRTKQTWPTRKITEKWIPKDTLTKQGYFEGARYIWVPKDKEDIKVPKQQKTSLDRSLADGQMKLKWVPKGQQTKQVTQPKTQVPR